MTVGGGGGGDGGLRRDDFCANLEKVGEQSDVQWPITGRCWSACRASTFGHAVVRWPAREGAACVARPMPRGFGAGGGESQKMRNRGRTNPGGRRRHTSATQKCRPDLRTGQQNFVHGPPPIGCCTSAQDAVGTKSAERKWLVSGLKDQRDLFCHRVREKRMTNGRTPTTPAPPPPPPRAVGCGC